LLEISARDLRLFSAEGRNMFLSNCTHNNLEISCVDNSTDLCPNGHLQYGLVTIGPVALPGICKNFFQMDPDHNLNSHFQESYLLFLSSFIIKPSDLEVYLESWLDKIGALFSDCYFFLFTF